MRRRFVKRALALAVLSAAAVFLGAPAARAIEVPTFLLQNAQAGTSSQTEDGCLFYSATVGVLRVTPDPTAPFDAFFEAHMYNRCVDPVQAVDVFGDLTSVTATIRPDGAAAHIVGDATLPDLSTGVNHAIHVDVTLAATEVIRIGQSPFRGVVSVHSSLGTVEGIMLVDGVNFIVPLDLFSAGGIIDTWRVVNPPIPQP